MENNAEKALVPNGDENSSSSTNSQVVPPPTPPADPTTQTEVKDQAPSNNQEQTEPAATPASSEGDNVEAINNQINLQDMETTELRVKIICLEKNNMSLKMELKCAELQMEAKTKVDAQKTRLIELLDGKVSTLQKKNVHLMDMLEGLLKEKDTHSHRLIEATKHMENLGSKLAESERMRNELRNMNQELKMMLGNIEDKGSQIAKLAKEKILKYKEESIKMQQQLDDMKKTNTSAAAAADEAGAAIEETKERFQQNWKKIDELQQQLANAFQAESTGSLSESTANINGEIKQELEQLRLEINTVLDSNQEENTKLQLALHSIRPSILELQELSVEQGKAIESPGSKDETTSAEGVHTGQEASQLRERLSSIVTKLVDLSSSSALVK